MDSIEEQVAEAMNTPIGEQSKSPQTFELNGQSPAETKRTPSPLHPATIRVPKPSDMDPESPTPGGTQRAVCTSNTSPPATLTKPNSVLTEEDLEVFSPFDDEDRFTSKLFDRVDRKFNESVAAEGLPSYLGVTMPANFVAVKPEKDEWDVIEEDEGADFPKKKSTSAEADLKASKRQGRFFPDTDLKVAGTQAARGLIRKMSEKYGEYTKYFQSEDTKNNESLKK